jgi:tRNA(Ile2) C34 agmatinyltransferase TiaS
MTRSPKRPQAGISRQRLWQIAKVKSGKCMICGNRRKGDAYRCDRCRVKQNLLLKKRRALQRAVSDGA